MVSFFFFLKAVRMLLKTYAYLFNVVTFHGLSVQVCFLSAAVCGTVYFTVKIPLAQKLMAESSVITSPVCYPMHQKNWIFAANISEMDYFKECKVLHKTVQVLSELPAVLKYCYQDAILAVS